MKKSTLLSKHSLSILLLTVALCFSNANLAAANSINFTTKIAEDATPEVLAKIQAIKGDLPTEIVFEKGTYHFYPDKAQEFFTFISNHNDNLTRTAFPLIAKKNVTINGQGSTFIFHGKMIPFLIEKSENIKITNLAIDWAMTFHSECKVIARDTINKTFDLQISEEYPYVIRNGQIYFEKEWYEHNLGQTILYDPARNAVAYDTESYTNITTLTKTKVLNNIDKIKYKYTVDARAPEMNLFLSEDKTVFKQLSPGIVRVYNHTKKMPQVGLILTTKGVQSANRLSPAFRILETKEFNALNVDVHHAGGMGLIAENSTNLTLDNFNVTPSNGRMVSTTADATHFVGCRGKVILKNCTFKNQLDDACNVHGTYLVVEDIIDENTLGIRIGHFQQENFKFGFENDTVGIVNLNKSFFAHDKLTIKSLELINGRYQKITFNEKLPANLKVGDYLENLSAYPELYVQNCIISGNRARGLLISTPCKTVIENNFFSTQMEAILVPVESGFWFESGSALNLTIRNNIFQDSSFGGQDKGVIRFETDDENHNIAFKNIEITNNKINHFDNMILEISNVENLLFKGNTITNSGTFPKLFPTNPVIKVRASKQINFEKNTYKGDAKIMIEEDTLSPKLKFK